MRMQSNTWITSTTMGVAAVALALLPARPVTAVQFDVVSEEVTVVEVEETADRELVGPSSLFAGFQYRTTADIDKGGSFNAPTFAGGGSMPLNLSEDIKLKLIANYRAILYNFRTGHKIQGPLGTLPWDAVHTFTVAAIAQGNLDDQWALFGGPFVRGSSEIDVDIGDFWTGGAMVGFKYFHSETLTLGLALVFMTQLEDDPVFAPLPVVNWHFAETMDLRIGMNNTGAGNGYGAEVGWQFAENWNAGVGLQFMKERFRLDNEGASNNGIGQDRGVPIYLKIGCAISETIGVEAFLGTVAAGELKMETKTGKKVQKNDYDGQPFLGVRANLTVF